MREREREKTRYLWSKMGNCGYPGVKRKRCKYTSGMYCWIRPPLARCPPIICPTLENNYRQPTSRTKTYFCCLRGKLIGSDSTFFKAPTWQFNIQNVILIINDPIKTLRCKQRSFWVLILSVNTLAFFSFTTTTTLFCLSITYMSAVDKVYTAIIHF